MKFNKAAMTVMLAIASGAFLAAATPQWGVQGALAFPQGDLSDSASVGLQGGGHARWDFGQGHGLMARGDLTLYGQRHGFSDDSLGIAADYTYHLDRNRRGLYFLGGLSLVDYHWDARDGRSHTDTVLGPDLGVGYDLNRNVGLQGRYTFHSASGSSSLDSLNLGVTYTF